MESWGMAPTRSLWPRSLRSHGFPAQSETRSGNSRAPLWTCVLMSLCQTAWWQEFFFSVGAKFWDLLVFQAMTNRFYPSSWCSFASACWQVSAGTSFPWYFGLCCTADGHRALPCPPAPASVAEVALSRLPTPRAGCRSCCCPCPGQSHGCFWTPHTPAGVGAVLPPSAACWGFLPAEGKRASLPCGLASLPCLERFFQANPSPG